MTTPQHRVHTPDPDDVAVREVTDEQGGDGLFRVRMPVTSTAEARDGVAFDRDKVEGFREQIAGERIPVFLDHGRNDQTGHRYSALGKVGYLDQPELRERDATTDLVSDFVLVDPDELDGSVGKMREALTWLRHQAALGLPLASSIGWSEDTGERDLPGDADLLEASIVGIPSDARTTTDQASAEPALARAVSAASEDFDVRVFMRELASELPDDARPFGPPDGDGDEFEDFEDCVETVLEDNPDMDRDDAEALCASWQQDDGTGATDDATNDMTDDTDESGKQPDDEHDESDGIDAAEFRNEMLEMQRAQTETLNTLAEAIRADGDDDDEDMDGDDEDDDDEDMNENAADADASDERTVTLGGEEMPVDEARDHIADLREEAADLDSGDVEKPATQDRADDDAEAADDSGASAPDWHA